MTPYIMSESNGILLLVKATHYLVNTSRAGGLNNLGEDGYYNCSVYSPSTISDDNSSQCPSESSVEPVNSLHTLSDHSMYIEQSTSIRPIYMEDQKYMTTHLRTGLVLFLTKLHLAHKLEPEVLSLAVNILDRFMTKRIVEMKEVKSLGVVCLLIASKVLGGNCYLCQNEKLVEYLTGLVYYTTDDVKRIELDILARLDYRVSVPTSYTFLYIYLEASGGLEQKDIAQDALFIQECTLSVYHLLEHLPSEIASGSIFIARIVNGITPWSMALVKCTTRNEDAISPIAKSILAVMPHIECMFELKWIKDKYNKMNKSKISTMQELNARL